MNGRRPLMLLLMTVAAAAVCLLRLMVDRPPGGSLSLAWPHVDWIQFRLTAMVTARSARFDFFSFRKLQK